MWNIEQRKAPDRQCISFSLFFFEHGQLSRIGHVLYSSLRIEFNPGPMTKSTNSMRRHLDRQIGAGGVVFGWQN